ncbi:MAG: hypothetical protein HZA62_02170 [Rhodocyclales bacterium]|nr:hypothetical protein [Rhodocyclales bacterium]
MALAQGGDPMRPPEGAAADAGGLAPAAQSGVQTIIVRPKGKSVAVINGKQVSVGDRLGDKKVMKISEREIVLKGESGREVIKVMPTMEKIPVKPASGAKARTGGPREGSEAK